MTDARRCARCFRGFRVRTPDETKYLLTQWATRRSTSRVVRLAVLQSDHYCQRCLAFLFPAVFVRPVVLTRADMPS